MTKQDRKIFNFIMSLTEYQYDVWLETIDNDYVDYVNGLFEEAHAEVDNELAKDFLNEAQMVLAKFTLKA